jgi:nitroreductase
MKPVSNETVLRQLQWRHATKKFDATQRISEEDWMTLEQALILTPSSYGLQPWKFVVITDPATKAQLLPLSWGQRQIIDGSHLVVFAIRQNLSEADIDKYLMRIVEVRGGTVDALAGFRRMMVGGLLDGATDLNHWASLQVFIALGQFMTTAAMLGIDTCPMEGIEPTKYDEVLGLNEFGYGTVVACVAGYRASDDKYASVAKVRFKAEDVVLRIESK